MKYILLLLLFAGMASCMENAGLNEPEKKRISEEVKTMFGHYHDAIKKEGLTGEFKYLDSSNDFFWVPPGYTSTLSFDSVKAILEKNAPSFKAIEFSFDTLQIFPLSSSLANYSGIVSGTMVDTAGISSSVKIIESGTVVKRADGWKLLCGQSAAINTISGN